MLLWEFVKALFHSKANLLLNKKNYLFYFIFIQHFVVNIVLDSTHRTC